MMQIRCERFINRFTCIWNLREVSVYFYRGGERVAEDGLRRGLVGFSVLLTVEAIFRFFSPLHFTVFLILPRKLHAAVALKL